MKINQVGLFSVNSASRNQVYANEGQPGLSLVNNGLFSVNSASTMQVYANENEDQIDNQE